MKQIFFLLAILFFLGCSAPLEKKTAESGFQDCPGNTQIPEMVRKGFKPVTDQPLLNAALGRPEEGKLCQGRVYESTATSRVTIFRAWNSTNPNSKMGHWWAFQEPKGKVSQYRSGYEICYQWSPLDALVRCTLKPGVRVVVGTGQSARCSQYLTYPVSAEKQIFLEAAESAVLDCIVSDAVFSWQQR